MFSAVRVDVFVSNYKRLPPHTGTTQLQSGTLHEVPIYSTQLGEVSLLNFLQQTGRLLLCKFIEIQELKSRKDNENR